MLTVIRLGLPDGLRRSLGCTNAIESLMAVVRQVCATANVGAMHGWHCDGLTGNAGGRERLPPFEGSQAAPNSANRLAAPSASSAR